MTHGILTDVTMQTAIYTGTYKTAFTRVKENAFMRMNEGAINECVLNRNCP